jgi:protein-disulfide isomerase
MSKNARVTAARSAREKVQRQRAQERRSTLIKRTIFGVIGAAVAVVAITVAIMTADTGSSGGPLVTPANAQGTTVVYGKADAPHTLQVYEDFRCPVCKNLELTQGKAIKQLADDGTYKIEYTFGTFLDGNLGGSGSLNALSAAGAALNQSVEKFKEFHDVLYANQPEESSDKFADTDYLLELAGQVPGLKTDQFVKDVKNGTYKAWAKKVSDAFDSSGVSGTPTLKLDGKQLDTNAGTIEAQVKQATAK